MMEKRKKEQIEIALNENVKASRNYWDDYHLVHNALPEIDMDEIDMAIKLFGKKLRAPIIIAGMTGGFKGAKEINETLARVASTYGIGMGVGSQRAALENDSLAGTYSIINEYEIPLKIANIGAPQLIEWEDPLSMIKRAMEMIEADVLAIHLNFLQESIQLEGETNAKGCLDKIEEISSSINKPVIIKETGAGISREVAKRLKNSGISGIDIGGMGGASFSAIESHRARMKGDEIRERLGNTFWDWGIPTPQSLIEVKEECDLPIIATGGIRNGLDSAKALSMGASAVGLASSLLRKYPRMEEEMRLHLKELKTAMFLSGSKNVMDLKRARIWKD
jgi:isopentenyl-diphosphate delta-isomerase